MHYTDSWIRKPFYGYRDEVRKWINSKGRWNFQMTLHFPRAYLAALHLRDEIAIAKNFYLFTKDIDRVLYRNANRRKAEKLPRAVVFQKSPDVGWHVHMAAQHKHPSKVQKAYCDGWHRRCGEYKSPKFERFVFQTSLIESDFVGYMTETCDNEHTFIDYLVPGHF